MANISSQLFSAQAENKASDYSAGTIGRFWINTSTSLLKFDDGSAVRTVVTTDNTQTLTNKTLTGNIAVNLVSGAAIVTLPTTTSTLATLALAETLTNKTIAGLSFTTFAKGDILYASAADTLARLPIGSNGQTLKVATDVPAWQSSANTSTTVSKTANYTLTSNDDVVFANADGASSFTLTLPAAASNSGKVYRIKKTGSDVAKTITIDGNASETINGTTTYILYTLNEEVEIVCDGSNWQVLNHITDTGWISWTPTGSWTANTPVYSGFYKRIGDTAHYQVKVVLGGAPDAAGLTITTNSTIDSTKILTTRNTNLGSVGYYDASTGNEYKGYVKYTSTSAVSIEFFGYSASSGTNLVTASGPITNSAPYTMAVSDEIIAVFSVPISGWNP